MAFIFNKKLVSLIFRLLHVPRKVYLKVQTENNAFLLKKDSPSLEMKIKRNLNKKTKLKRKNKVEGFKPETDLMKPKKKRSRRPQLPRPQTSRRWSDPAEGGTSSCKTNSKKNSIIKCNNNDFQSFCFHQSQLLINLQLKVNN